MQVTFDIDTNIIISISVADVNTGKKNKISITNDNGYFSKDDVDQIIKEVEKHKLEDEVNRDMVAARNTIESYTFNGLQTV